MKLSALFFLGFLVPMITNASPICSGPFEPSNRALDLSQVRVFDSVIIDFGTGQMRFGKPVASTNLKNQIVGPARAIVLADSNGRKLVRWFGTDHLGDDNRFFGGVFLEAELGSNDKVLKIRSRTFGWLFSIENTTIEQLAMQKASFFRALGEKEIKILDLDLQPGEPEKLPLLWSRYGEITFHYNGDILVGIDRETVSSDPGIIADSNSQKLRLHHRTTINQQGSSVEFRVISPFALQGLLQFSQIFNVMLDDKKETQSSGDLNNFIKNRNKEIINFIQLAPDERVGFIFSKPQTEWSHWESISLLANEVPREKLLDAISQNALNDELFSALPGASPFMDLNGLLRRAQARVSTLKGLIDSAKQFFVYKVQTGPVKSDIPILILENWFETEMAMQSVYYKGRTDNGFYQFEVRYRHFSNVGKKTEISPETRFDLEVEYNPSRMDREFLLWRKARVQGEEWFEGLQPNYRDHRDFSDPNYKPNLHRILSYHPGHPQPIASLHPFWVLDSKPHGWLTFDTTPPTPGGGFLMNNVVIRLTFENLLQHDGKWIDLDSEILQWIQKVEKPARE